MAQVLNVASVQLTLQKSNPPSILVEAQGTVGTPGWRNIRLERLEKVLSADGILDLDFVGDPPTDPIIQVVRPVTADFVIDPKEAAKIVGVLVHARTGNVLGSLGGGGAAPGPAAGFAAQAANFGNVTTFALGEEGKHKPVFGEDLSTAAIGEEDPWGTFASRLGESPPLTPQVEKIVHSSGEKWPIVEKLPVTEKFAMPAAEKFAVNLGEKNPFHSEAIIENIPHKPAGFGEGGPGPDPVGPMFFSPFGVR